MKKSHSVFMLIIHVLKMVGETDVLMTLKYISSKAVLLKNGFLNLKKQEFLSLEEFGMTNTLLLTTILMFKKDIM